MSLTLVDTSVWIDFFRGRPGAVKRVDQLLASAEAAICGPIYAEVLSGAGNRPRYEKLARELEALEWLEPPSQIWREIAASRFMLARLGAQAHVVDLYIAHTASAAGARLLTSDRDFEVIGRTVPLDLTVI